VSGPSGVDQPAGDTPSMFDDTFRALAAARQGAWPRAAHILERIPTDELQGLFMTTGRFDQLVRREVFNRIRAKTPTDRG
jgi:hypothetical protein